MNRIIELNLELMLSAKEGGMIFLASRESVGGNAGSIGGYNCLGANFHFSPKTGLIEVFKNQHKNDKYDVQGTYRLMANFHHSQDQSVLFRIPDLWVPKGTLLEVTQILRQSAVEYNKIKGKNYPPAGQVLVKYLS
jgi:hypothetical protein